MSKRDATLVVLSLICSAPASAQELHAGIGYAHVFRAGGFSLATGYLHTVGAATAAAHQRVGGEFWYANTDVASQPAGNAGRDVVGLGARYEIELTRCCGRMHPVAAVPVQVIHSSIPDRAAPQSGAAALVLAPKPSSDPPVEDRSGSAWGWGAGLEFGLRLQLGAQWMLETTGTALYQDVYAESSSNSAWTWHVGMGYRFGS